MSIGAMKMKTRGHYVISDSPGEFFLTEFSLDGRMYLKDGKWVISRGVLILRWPGTFETFDKEEVELAIIRHEKEAQEASQEDLINKVEKVFPIRKWVKGECN